MYFQWVCHFITNSFTLRFYIFLYDILLTYIPNFIYSKLISFHSLFTMSFGYACMMISPTKVNEKKYNIKIWMKRKRKRKVKIPSDLEDFTFGIQNRNFLIYASTKSTIIVSSLFSSFNENRFNIASFIAFSSFFLEKMKFFISKQHTAYTNSSCSQIFEY